MTTAARPTFLPAMGGNTIRDSTSISSKVIRNLDMPSELTLKTRQPGQNAPEDIQKKDLLQELLDREHAHFNKQKKHFLDIEGEDLNTKKQRFIQEAKELDVDDSSGNEQEDDEDDSSSEDDEDDEDDTALLMKELEKIKRERALEKERMEREKMEHEMEQREEEALTGNPLLQSSLASASDFVIKKRWDEDVIFKNQAKNESDKPKKRFINDMLRSDFHRKFMSKYIK